MASAASPRAHHSLLGLDPDLGQLLDADRREEVRRELVVRVVGMGVGEWDASRLAAADPRNVGLLVVEGVMAREVVVGDTVSTELLGTGDVVRPWQHLAGEPELLRIGVRWNALSDVRVAILDRRAAAALVRYPEVNAVLIDRLSERAQRLAVGRAIAQLHRVDVRVVAMLWHIAGRWGRVTADGVVVPLVLSHRMLGQLVGARRPTVSTAVAQLAREDRVQRRDDGTWLVRGEPLGVEVEDAEVVRQRRRLMPVSALEDSQVTPAASPAGPPLAEIREAVRALRERAADRRTAFRDLCEQAKTLHDRSAELRGVGLAAGQRRTPV